MNDINDITMVSPMCGGNARKAEPVMARERGTHLALEGTPCTAIKTMRVHTLAVSEKSQIMLLHAATCHMHISFSALHEQGIFLYTSKN